MINFHPEMINRKESLYFGLDKIYAYQKDPEDKEGAVKEVIFNKPQDLAKIIQEITFLSSCESPYILSMVGYSIHSNEDKNQWTIYTKLPRMKTSLRSVEMHHKEIGKRIPEEDILQYFSDIAQGLQDLHEKKIVHRAIQSNNILLDADGQIKIAEFGFARFLKEEILNDIAEKINVPLFYVAPENENPLKNKELLQGDLWNLGMIILELCMLGFSNLDHDLFGKDRQACIKEEIGKLGGEYSEILLRSITGLLQEDPSKRITLQQVQKELVELKRLVVKQSLESQWGNYCGFEREGERGLRIKIKNK